MEKKPDRNTDRNRTAQGLTPAPVIDYGEAQLTYVLSALLADGYTFKEIREASMDSILGTYERLKNTVVEKKGQTK